MLWAWTLGDQKGLMLSGEGCMACNNLQSRANDDNVATSYWPHLEVTRSFLKSAEGEDFNNVFGFSVGGQ